MLGIKLWNRREDESGSILHENVILRDTMNYSKQFNIIWNKTKEIQCPLSLS